MTLGDAINGLGEQTEWLTVKAFILEQTGYVPGRFSGLYPCR